MSGASFGLLMLFVAMHASIVTSAMATQTDSPTKHKRAMATGRPVMADTIRDATVPSIPVPEFHVMVREM